MNDADDSKDSITTREALQPDLVARETLQLTRRTFFATCVLVGLGSIPIVEGAPGFLRDLEESYRRYKEAEEREEELQELLTSYLYPSIPGGDLQVRVPLVPAMQDPWGPPKRQFSGSGNAVAAAYISAFSPKNNKHIVQPIIDVQDDDAPVLIASHLVSESAAKYFGNPKSTYPIHEVHYHDFGERGAGFKANIRWTIYTPEGAKQVKRHELFQGSPDLRREPVHNLSDLDDPRLHQPVFKRQGDIDYQLNDYLLITVLPRDSRLDRRMVSLAGLHKPGTLAAEQFLSNRNTALKILREIDKKVQGLPYYQALIAAKVEYSSGLPRPIDLELKGVQPITGVTRF